MDSALSRICPNASYALIRYASQKFTDMEDAVVYVLDHQDEQETHDQFGQHIKNVTSPLMAAHENIPTSVVKYRSITNGDCCAHSLGLALKLLHDSYSGSDSDHIEMAKWIRNIIFDYQQQNWNGISILNNLPWHDIVTLTHHTSIPNEEREIYGEWGTSANSRLTAWLRERGDFYLGESEILAFVEMCSLRGLELIIRVHRKFNKKLHMVTTIPDGKSFGHIVDLLHSGASDTVDAHYTLIKGGSIFRNVTSSSSEKKRKHG